MYSHNSNNSGICKGTINDINAINHIDDIA